MAAQLPQFSQMKQYKHFLGTYNKLIITCFMLKTSQQEKKSLIRPPIENIVDGRIFKW